MHHWRLGLLLFLMLPAVYAVESLDLTPVVPAVAVIVIIFLALSSMLATSISDPRLEAWTKGEIREFIAGIILIAVILAYFVGSDGISIALTGESDYVGHSQAIIDGWLAKYDTTFNYIIQGASRIRAAATYAPYINVPLWYVSISYSTNPLAGIGVLLGTLNRAAQALTNAIFIAEGIRMLLAFLKVTVPTVLLPLSFCVRLIPFTRKTGNTLIAISLASIVFLPLGVILADMLNSTIPHEAFPDPKMTISNLDADPWAMVAFSWACEVVPIRFLLSLTDLVFAIIVCLPLLLAGVTAALFPPCVNLVQNVVYPIINIIFQVVGAVLMLAWEISYGGAASDEFVDAVWNEVQPFLRDVNNLVFIGYIDFIVIAIVTIAGARSLSAALGGEWYMAGIQRLI